MGARGEAPEQRIADAVGNWVDTLAPAPTRPFLRLARADRPIGTWLLLLPCWWGALLAAAATPGSADATTVWILIGCGIGAVLMRGAGCTWNDITDRDIDGHVARTRGRPLPSGQVGTPAAVIWMLAQMAVAFLVLVTFHPLAIALGIGSLTLVAIYPFAKRFTWWPQMFLGLAFNWGALLAWAAQTGSLGWAPLLLYASGIAWTIFYDTIYAHQDKDDDALIGIRSTALLFGERTKEWLAGFLVVTVALLAAAVLVALGPRGGAALGLGLAGVAVFAAHLVWQLRRLDPDDGALCLRLFRSNRDAGLLFALFLALSLFV